jgi:AcrR family transcriptional regulator
MTKTPRAADTRRPSETLGRKGQLTRRRLMAAAQDLLQTYSPVSLTATAVARSARTSSATFYVYFDDVKDVALALATEASDDLEQVRQALDAWRVSMDVERGARAFFDAYQSYWNRHRAILSIRNMEADRGDERFLAVRSRSGMGIIAELAMLIRKGHPDGVLDDEQSLARATVIFAAIERLASTATLYARTRSDVRGATDAALAEAQIAILATLVKH